MKHWLHRKDLRAATCLLTLCILAAPARSQGQDAQSSAGAQDFSLPVGSNFELQQRYSDDMRRFQTLRSAQGTWENFLVALQRTTDNLKTISAPAIRVESLPDYAGLRNVSNVRGRSDLTRAVDAMARQFYDPFSNALTPINIGYSPPGQTTSEAQREVENETRMARAPWDQVANKPEYRLIYDFNYPIKAPDETPSVISGGELLDAATAAFGQRAFEDLRAALTASVTEALKRAKQKSDYLGKQTTEVSDRLKDAAAKLEADRTSINEIAIKLGLPLFCITIAALFLGSQWMLARQQTNGDVGAMFSTDVLLNLITVLLLTMTILILGLSGKIQGEVLGTLLGGISGYVLNRLSPGRSRQNGNESNKEP